MKNNRIYSLLILSTLILAVFLYGGLKIASAQIISSFTISPPVVSVDLNPGDKTQGLMKIINNTSSPLQYNMTIQDFDVTGTDGIPTILPINTLSPKFSASSWIGLDTQTITVPAHTRTPFNYYIQVPKNARPGGHYAAVMFSPVTSNTINGSGAAVHTTIGSLFYVTVNGNIQESAKVEEFKANQLQEYSPITVNTIIRNDGDLHIRPIGSIKLTDMLGRVIAQQTLPQYNIFPGGGRRAYQNTFGRNMFMFGAYTAKLSATYGKNNNLPLMATITIWILPWKIIAVIILVLIALLLIVKLLKKGNKVEKVEAEDKEQTPSAKA